MKHLKFIIPAVIIIILSNLSLTASDETETQPASKKKINWMAYDVGLKKAKEENKHIFIDFTTTWCGYCKKMEREAFSDPTVIGLLNENFISVKVDGDSKDTLDIDGYLITERQLATQEYKVTGYPTFWWLKPDGSRVGGQPGYKSTKWMIGALTFVKDYKYDTTRTQTTPQPKQDTTQASGN